MSQLDRRLCSKEDGIGKEHCYINLCSETIFLSASIGITTNVYVDFGIGTLPTTTRPIQFKDGSVTWRHKLG
ncbi:hypothetical protein EYF80_026073 [Liparis tanakae]|uniref:Uncharacterized protein n=1 Tax=Liparis tanakae TaxID=230148 RepID=A0A4Z2HEE3_9TELE|nr:hypothetical protein EYF80_026073 [Liparis tanakae]